MVSAAGSGREFHSNVPRAQSRMGTVSDFKQTLFLVHFAYFFGNRLKTNNYTRRFAFALRFLAFKFVSLYIFHIIRLRHLGMVKALPANSVCLAHCKMGMNRSASVAVAILSYYSDWDQAIIVGVLELVSKH